MIHAIIAYCEDYLGTSVDFSIDSTFLQLVFQSIPLSAILPTFGNASAQLCQAYVLLTRPKPEHERRTSELVVAH